MRPILYGIIFFFIGLVGWLGFSVVYGVAAGLGNPTSLEGWFFIYSFGLMFFFSLPVAIVAEIVRAVRRRRSK